MSNSQQGMPNFQKMGLDIPCWLLVIEVDLLPVFERHGVAEIVSVIGGAATVEADVLGIHHEPFNLFELLLTHKDTQVPGMVVR